MKSLISDKSRDAIEHAPKHKATEPVDDGKKRKLYVLVGLCVAVAAVAVILRPWETSAPETPADPKAVQSNDKLTARLKELEEADQRLRPPPAALPPTPTPTESANQPTSLRGKKTP